MGNKNCIMRLLCWEGILKKKNFVEKKNVIKTGQQK